MHSGFDDKFRRQSGNFFVYALTRAVKLHHQRDKAHRADDKKNPEPTKALFEQCCRIGNKPLAYVRKQHSADTDARRQSHVGHRSQYAALFAVARGHRHKRTVCRVIKRIRYGKKQVVGKCRKHHCKYGIACGVGDQGNCENEHYCKRHYQTRSQYPRARLAAGSVGVLYQLPDKQVAEHYRHAGSHGKYRQKHVYCRLPGAAFRQKFHKQILRKVNIQKTACKQSACKKSQCRTKPIAEQNLA